MRYDVENLLADIKSLLVANLNNNIDTVEAEKVAQGLPATGLAHVDTTYGYFEQSWSDKILNVSPAIFYGVEDIKAEGIGPNTKQQIKIFVEVVYVDKMEDTLTKNRIHRYSRALRDLFEQNYDKVPSMSRIKVETVRPISFTLDLNTSEEIKIGGVSITTALG